MLKALSPSTLGPFQIDLQLQRQISNSTNPGRGQTGPSQDFSLLEAKSLLRRRSSSKLSKTYSLTSKPRTNLSATPRFASFLHKS